MEDVTGNSRRVKITMTAIAYCSMVVFGCMTYLIGPSRYDIAEQNNSDLTGVSYGPIGRSAGMGVGAMIVGLVLKKISRQTGDVIILTIAGLVQLSVPFTRSLWQYLGTEVAFGVTIGMHNVNRNAWLLEMWQESANPFMQGLHGIFGVGATLAPLFVAPFLSQVNSTTAYHRQSHIVIPYSVVSSLVVLFAGLMAILYHKIPYMDSKRKIGKSVTDVTAIVNDDVSDKNSTSQTSATYERLLVILSCLSIGSYVGVELSTLGFSATFVYCIPLDFSKVEAAHVASAVTAAYAVNRLISIYIATKVRTRDMLIGSFFVLLTGNILLMVFANSNKTMVWVAFIVIGGGHSNVYPSFLSFLEERINVTTKLVGYFMLCACFAGLVIPVLLGRFLEQYPPVFVFVNLTGLCICGTAFCAILYLDHRCGYKDRNAIINDRDFVHRL